MTRRRNPPDHLILPYTHVPDDFGRRLDALKQRSGLTWDGMAECLGVDLRQLQRWRMGTAPSGHALFSLFLLASRVQDGLRILLVKEPRREPVSAAESTLPARPGSTRALQGSVNSVHGRQLPLSAAEAPVSRGGDR